MDSKAKWRKKERENVSLRHISQSEQIEGPLVRHYIVYIRHVFTTTAAAAAAAAATAASPPPSPPPPPTPPPPRPSRL